MKLLVYVYWQWLRRDLAGRYRGSLLGLAWPVLQPLAQILVFTLVFYHFMRMRWPISGGEGNALDYGVNVFAGLAVFNFFAEVLARSPGAILAQPSLVTKVRFPVAILPAVVVGAAALHLLVGGVLVTLAMLVFREIGATVLLLPIYAIPMFLYALGVAWGLASLGVYLRDIGQMMPPLTSLLMFLTPIFYPATLVPASLGMLLDLNPISWSVGVFRELVMLGTIPAPGTALVHLSCSIALALLAKRLFRRLRRGFADVL